MSLVLGLTYVQYNDATKIVFSDASSGWGTDGDPDVQDVDTATLTLTGYPSGTVYALDVLAVFTAAGNDPANLIFEVDAGDLDGASGDEITDSLFYLDYSVDDGGAGPWDMDQLIILIDGQNQMRVFSKLMDAPSQIDMLDQLILYREQDWESVIEPLIWYTYYQGMNSSIYESKKIQVNNILTALTTITQNM